MRYLFLLLLLLLRAGLLPAQLSLFAGSSFEHEVTERWGYEFQVEHRQLLTTGRENRLLLQVAANRLISPNLNITPGARLTPDYGLGETVLRLFTDLNAAVPLGDTPLALEGRLRTQYERVWTEDGRASGGCPTPPPRFGVRAGGAYGHRGGVRGPLPLR
ncbi:hypothetical protein [Lewinella sp. IMCC34191]|uniref:hypothetical protein n=1 Tax=Lewinella sp. IMCC34191 TaxID=2259172 RepID=UPI000E22DFDF|nr:hypothetical protein [Lewinella sp. IMCC34191]